MENGQFCLDFEEIKKLGEGNSGSVYLVEDSNKRQYAAKYIENEKNEGISGSALIEIDALMRLRNTPNIINLIAVCYQIDTVTLVMEAMDYDLEYFIKITPTDIRLKLVSKLLNSLIRAAAQMQTNNIGHFDIKTNNVLVKGEEFKLADFGLSIPLTGTDIGPLVEIYSTAYRSPELLSYRDKYTYNIFKSEIWALGIVLVEFIIGGPLFPQPEIDYEEEFDINTYISPEKQILTLLYEMQNPINMTYEDFVTANEDGTITGSLSIKNIVSSSNQLHIRIMNVLSRMLSFNPNQRPTGITLLNELGEKVINKYIQSYYDHRINIDGINSILDAARSMRLSKISTLIAIEIFTRYLAMKHTNRDLYFESTASLKIAKDFAEIYFTEFSFRYMDYRRGLSNDIMEQIINAEKDILENIKFQIYNTDLDSVIERAELNNIDLQKVKKSEFTKPVSQWLS